MKLPRAATGHVLALDIANCTGWCGGAFGARPRFGAIQLRGSHPVEKWAALRDWLDDYEKVSGRVTALVLEAAIMTARDNAGTIELLWGLRHAAMMWAYDGSLSTDCVQSYGSSTVRAHMLGNGNIPANVVKQHVMAWCSRADLSTNNDNAADAVLTWKYAEALVNGTPRAPAGMFWTKAA